MLETVISPWSHSQIFAVEAAVGMLAIPEPRLYGFAEMDDIWISPQLIHLWQILRHNPRLLLEIESRNIPFVWKQHYLPTEINGKAILVVVQHLLICLQEINHRTLFLFLPPSLQVNHHHSAVDIQFVILQAQTQAMRLLELIVITSRNNITMQISAV